MADKIRDPYDFSIEQLKQIDEYMQENMFKLKNICHGIWRKDNVDQSYYDDLYDDAVNVLLESVETYDPNNEKQASFKTFLTGNINRSYLQWRRDNFERAVRSNLLMENGKIVKDENGKPIQIINVSFDKPADDGIDLKETIGSDFSVEDATHMFTDQKYTEYIELLSEIQKKILILLMEGMKSMDIKKTLKLSDKDFTTSINDMRSYEKKKVLMRENKSETENIQCNLQEEESFMGTSEKTKNTSYSIEAIAKKLKRRQLRDDHVLQRHSGQWNQKDKSELMSDILQGKALTQIIISEEIKNGIQMLWLIDGKQRCTNIDDYMADGFAISNNIQIWNIAYQTDQIDENGNVVLNEDGFPIPVVKHFDIRKKKFSQLPEELQDRFKEYQIPVMLNLNCTKKDIAYDIARFNRCRPMNIAQNGWTGMDEEYAELIDNILKMNFFSIDSNHSSYTGTNVKNGSMRRMIVESIVLSYFKDEYKSDFKDFRKMCEFISENAPMSDITNFHFMIDTLDHVTTEKTAHLFNIKNSFIWFSVFNDFLNTGYDSKLFGEFLNEFVDTLHMKVIDGYTYDDLDGANGSKDRRIVFKRFDHIKTLINDFLLEKGIDVVSEEKENIESEDNEHSSLETTEEKREDIIKEPEIVGVDESLDQNDINFVHTYVDEKADPDDIEFYNECLQDTKVSAKVYQQCKTALIALMMYAAQNNQDQEFEKWIAEYQSSDDEYSSNQGINFKFMKRDFENYLIKNKVA